MRQRALRGLREGSYCYTVKVATGCLSRAAQPHPKCSSKMRTISKEVQLIIAKKLAVYVFI